MPSTSSVNRRLAGLPYAPTYIDVREYSGFGDSVWNVDVPALEAAITAATSPVAVGYPYDNVNIYDHDQQVDIATAENGIIIKGEGGRATKLTFNPSANGSLFRATMAQTVFNVRDLMITSEDTTYVKTAIEAIDISQSTFLNLNIGGGGGAGWTDTSTTSSIGIKVNGREVTTIDTVTCFSDKPIVFGPNPNHANLDVDQFNLNNLYLVVTLNAANANIEIEDATNVFALTVTGYQAWARGRWGLYWANTTNASISHMLDISNVRHEQGYEGGGTGWVIYIEHDDFNIQNLKLTDIKGDSSLTNGTYIKGAREVYLDNIETSCTGTPLQIVDNSSGATKFVEWKNCQWGGSGSASIIPDTLRLIPHTSIRQYDGNYSLPTSAAYVEKRAYPYLDLGDLVTPDVYKYYASGTLLAPQTSSTDLSFSGTTITSGGTIDFTGIKKGDSIHINTALNANAHARVSADGTTTTLTTQESWTTETNVTGTLIHGANLQYRGAATNMTSTRIQIVQNSAPYMSNSFTSKTGSIVTEYENDNTILAVNGNSTSTAPVSDIVSYTAITAPARLWNNRTTSSSSVTYIIEQLHW